MSWILVVIFDMGILRPPAEYRYTMPNQEACMAAVSQSRLDASDEKPVIIFCAADEVNRK